MRLPTLSAAVVPVLVGSAVGHHETGRFNWLAFVLALIAAVAIQVGTNFVNDLADSQRGADNEQRVGPVRGLQSGQISKPQLRLVTLAVFGLAVLCGLVLVLTHGWPVLVIGLASMAAGYAYTAGPYPLAYHGLGDVFVFLFFGLVAVMGSAYLQTGGASSNALLAAIPVGLLCTAILVVNNVRDVEADRAAAKHTLPVLLGRQFGLFEYVATVATANLMPPVIWLHGVAYPWFLAWLSLPLAVWLVLTMLRESAPQTLNICLKRTGQLHLLFGVLFAVSWLW
jgi:1,4-dihydroxy-2-naphthoate octaprenyltransferase